jgi:hypothetical protein
MLELLHKAIEELPALMQSHEGWNSVDVTYHPPRVERLWCQWGDNRILLHRIYPCEVGEALAHPHPWPSAIRIVKGHYEHSVGKYDSWPSVGEEGWEGTNVGFHAFATSILPAGAEYEMVDRFAWHSVRPLGVPSDSIMVIGPLFKPPVDMPEPPKEKQGALSPERFAELFDEWKERIMDYADQRNPPVECGTCGWQGREQDLSHFTDEDQIYARGRR